MKSSSEATTPVKEKLLPNKTPLIDEIRKIAAEEEKATKPYSDDEIYRRLEPIVKQTRAIAEDETDENGMHPLMYAARHHLPNVIRVLYKFSGITWRGTRDPNVHYEDNSGNNALLYALDYEYDKKVEARELRKGQETLDLLLEHGANPWLTTKVNFSPVALACHRQNIYFIKKMPKTTEFNLGHAVAAAKSNNPDIFPYLMDKYKQRWNYDRSKNFGKYSSGMNGQKEPDFSLSDVDDAKNQVSWLRGIFDNIATSDPAIIKKVLDYFIKVKKVLPVPTLFWSKSAYGLEHVDISLIMLVLFAWVNREPLNYQDNTLKVIEQYFVSYITNDCLQYAVMGGYVDILKICHKWKVPMTGPMEFGGNSFGNAGFWRYNHDNKIMLKSLLETAVVSTARARDTVAYLIEIGSSQTIEAMKMTGVGVIFPRLREGKKELIIQGFSLDYFNNKFPDDIAAFCLAIRNIKAKEPNLSSTLKSLPAEDKDDLRKYFKDDQESLNVMDRALGKEGAPAIVVVTTAVLPPPPSAPALEGQADFKAEKGKASFLSVPVNPAAEGLPPPVHIPEKNESVTSFSLQVQRLLDLLLVNSAQLKAELIPIVGEKLIFIGCALMPEAIKEKSASIELSLIIATLKDVVSILKVAEGDYTLRPRLFSMAGRELTTAGESLLGNTNKREFSKK